MIKSTNDVINLQPAIEFVQADLKDFDISVADCSQDIDPGICLKREIITGCKAHNHSTEESSEIKFLTPKPLYTIKNLITHFRATGEGLTTSELRQEEKGSPFPDGDLDMRIQSLRKEGLVYPKGSRGSEFPRRIWYPTDEALSLYDRGLLQEKFRERRKA